jgi:hypothetical protein
MKMLMVMSSDVIAEELRRVIDDLRLDCYLEIPKAYGCAGEFKRRNTYAFPGTTNCFFVPCSDERLDEIVSKLKAYEAGCKYEKCMRIMAVNVEKIF